MTKSGKLFRLKNEFADKKIHFCQVDGNDLVQNQVNWDNRPSVDGSTILLHVEEFALTEKFVANKEVLKHDLAGGLGFGGFGFGDGFGHGRRESMKKEFKISGKIPGAIYLCHDKRIWICQPDFKRAFIEACGKQ